MWNLSCRSLTQCFDLGEDSLPLTVRFLHNPDAAEGYVGCALSGVVFRFYKSCEASAGSGPGAAGGPGRAGARGGGGGGAGKGRVRSQSLGGPG